MTYRPDWSRLPRVAVPTFLVCLSACGSSKPGSASDVACTAQSDCPSGDECIDNVCTNPNSVTDGGVQGQTGDGSISGTDGGGTGPGDGSTPAQHDSGTALDGGKSPSPDAGSGDSGAISPEDGGEDSASVAGPCTAGATVCGPSNEVEVCNSTGTAWLYETTCASACSNGLCTGGCTPGATQCAGTGVETCDDAGTGFGGSVACATGVCSTFSNACALSATTIPAGNTNWDGVVVINGILDVPSGATITSPTGNLTIYASEIVVEQGGAIVMSPTGNTAAGFGSEPDITNWAWWDGPGGGYGGVGGSGEITSTLSGGSSANEAHGGGLAFGSTTDSLVQQGSQGGPSYLNDSLGGLGGGELHLFANSITIAGQLAANGQAAVENTTYAAIGGGGSGGGILLGADTISVSGTIVAAGGEPNGGLGRVKLLSGVPVPGLVDAGVDVTGALTEGLLPPVFLTSPSHPDPTLVYNDNFDRFDLSWSQPFPGVIGYYALASIAETVPAPGAAGDEYVTTEYTSLTDFTVPDDGGVVYLQVVPVNGSSVVGSVEAYLTVQVNTAPPTVTSTSNPTNTTWLTSGSPYFAWTFAVPDNSLSAAYYVFDHYPETIPGTSGTSVPLSQGSLQLNGIANGIWFFHLITADTQGRFTKVAAHYQANIGPNPGTGTLGGQVLSAADAGVASATVVLNRGVYSATTDSFGNYQFPLIPALAWEVTATSGSLSATGTATVVADGGATLNLTL